MFKQFTENITAHQSYLLFSLGVFLAFFIVVAIWLVRMPKPHSIQMGGLPLTEDDVTNTVNH